MSLATTDVGLIAEVDPATSGENAPVFSIDDEGDLVSVSTSFAATTDDGDVDSIAFGPVASVQVTRRAMSIPLNCAVLPLNQQLSSTFPASGIQAKFYVGSTSIELLIVTPAGAEELEAQAGSYIEVIVYALQTNPTVTASSTSNVSQSSLATISTSDMEASASIT